MALLAYLAFFTFFLWRWIGAADVGEPMGFLSTIEDRWLVPWIIGWISHSLTVDPGRIFDVPINHPAPAQLAAIEHFLSTALAVTPIFAATGNAVLAANVAAIASYPLAAFIMSRLLVALGCGGVVAWVGGLMFALGPERVPGNLIVLKYLNLYLPLVALCLTKLRDRPSPWRAAGLALALTAALFSSYYEAVLVTFCGGLWGLSELIRRRPERARYFAWAVGASLVAFALLTIFSLPYLARPEATRAPHRFYSASYLSLVLGMARDRILVNGGVQLALAALAALLLWRRTVVGVLARRGIAVATIGAIMMLGRFVIIAGYRITLPFAALAASPAGFFRYPYRFSVLFGFGLTLLFCATLQAVRERLAGTLGTALIVLLAFFALRGHARLVDGFATIGFPSVKEPIYDTVRQVAQQQGSGPLLELPNNTVPVTWRAAGLPRNEIQSMVGFTRHFQPLILGYVDFPPPHRALLDRAVARLPASDALDEIVDMTHVRWLLLRPAAEWSRPRDRAELMQEAGVTHIVAQDGWDLLRVDRQPGRTYIYDAIAAGPRRGVTILGVSLAKLTGKQARSTLAASIPRQATAASSFRITLTAINTGSAAWPVLSHDRQRVVHFVVHWRLAGAAPGRVVKRQVIYLLNDVAPGKSAFRLAPVKTPLKPGRYELEIKLAQGTKSAFDGPGNVPLRGTIEILPRRPKPS